MRSSTISLRCCLWRKHEHLPGIGYIHVADFPGRHEPGTGSMKWGRLLPLLQDLSYVGDVGFEYEPQVDNDETLEIIRSLLH